MAYFIFRSQDTSTPFSIINEQTVDNTSSSLTFVGRRRVDYGQSQQQNQLWLLENFAAATPPVNPISGQLWYDTGVSYLKVYNGTSFVRVSNTIVSGVTPSSPSSGQFWFDTSVNKLKVFVGSSFVEIGPDDSYVAFSIVFGS